MRDTNESIKLWETSPLARACNSTWYYYPDRGILPSLQSLFPDMTIRPKMVSPALGTALTILALYSMRVGELIGLTNENVLHGDRVLCKGLKQSNSFIIWLPGVSQQVARADVSRETFRLFPWRYMCFYRGFIKVGVRLSMPIGKNTRVTHASRYITARAVNKQSSSAVSGEVLRHRSRRSVTYYI